MSEQIERAKRAVRQASRSAVRDTLAGTCDNWLQNNTWVSSDNTYRTKDDRVLEEGDVKDESLRKYIAYSSIVHCIDAWSYVSHAIGASLRGDRATATHLGYYAELRAALSFLASVGVGVFHKKVAVIKENQDCLVCEAAPNTHTSVQDGLSTWLDHSDNADIVLQVVKVNNRSFAEWLQDTIGGTATPRVLATKWVETWGLDIQHISEDRAARNQVSYEPTLFALHESERAAYALCEEITALWRLCEPVTETTQRIDYLLLGMSFCKMYDAKNEDSGTVPSEGKISEIISSIGDGSELLRRVLPDLVNRYSWFREGMEKKANWDEPESHIPVLIRAFCFARLATALCQDSFLAVCQGNSNVLAPESLLSVGRRRGLWGASPPEAFIDLWDDIEPHVMAYTRDLEENSSDCTIYRHWSEMPEVMSQLSTFERVPFWGLGLDR